MPKSIGSAKVSEENFKVRFGTPVSNWVRINDKRFVKNTRAIQKMQNFLVGKTLDQNIARTQDNRASNENSKYHYATSHGADSDHDHMTMSPVTKKARKCEPDWLPNKLENKSLDSRYFSRRHATNQKRSENNDEIFKSSYDKHVHIPALIGYNSKTPLRGKGDRPITNQIDGLVYDMMLQKQKSVVTEPAAIER